MRNLILILLASSAWAATGDIVSVAIAGPTDGFSADATLNGSAAIITISGLAVGGTYSFGTPPFSPKLSITCTSNGYSSTGSTTTYSRTLYGTQFVRLPYNVSGPPTGSLTPLYGLTGTTANVQADESSSGGNTIVVVWLGDGNAYGHVYQSDASCVATVSGGLYTSSGTPNNAATGVSVTNNSTASYDAAMGAWSTAAYQVVSGSSFLLEATCFAGFAGMGHPCAAMVFSCTDGSHTVTATSSQMKPSSLVSGIPAAPLGMPVVLVYSAVISTSTFSQGTVTCNFSGYPWIGASGQVFDTSSGTSGWETGPLPLTYNSGTYGASYAAVKSGGGNNCADVKTTQSAADAATGFDTPCHAIVCLKSYNNSNFSRNNLDNSFLSLDANTYTIAACTDQGAQNAWMTIIPAGGVTQAQAILQGSATNNIYLGVRKLKLSGITIASNGAAVDPLFGNGATTNLWIDGSLISTAGAATASLSNWATVDATSNTVAGMTNGFRFVGGTTNRTRLIRSNYYSGTVSSTSPSLFCYNCLGNYNLWMNVPFGGNAGNPDPNGGIIAFNKVYSMTTGTQSSMALNDSTANRTTTGYAIVQNLFENKASGSAMFTISEGGANPTTNIIVAHNTVVGERGNFHYNAGYNGDCTSAVSQTHLHYFANIWAGNSNDKTDVFNQTACAGNARSGARRGNWEKVFGVGSSWELQIGCNFGSCTDTGSDFQPEVDGVGGIRSIANATELGFVATYASLIGSSAGNGDYRLNSTSLLKSLVPNNSRYLSYDLDGQLRSQGIRDSSGSYTQQRLLTPVLW